MLWQRCIVRDVLGSCKSRRWELDKDHSYNKPTEPNEDSLELWADTYGQVGTKASCITYFRLLYGEDFQ
jgi:hypothetical protein